MDIVKGAIANLTIRRRSRDFVMSEMQHRMMETTAVGAAGLGMGAQAIGLLNMSSNAEEDADWVEFELGGQPMKGWLWKMPMLNGDEVEVAAEKMQGDVFTVFSIRRPSDGVVAVYPHAASGRVAKYLSIMKMMLIIFAVVYCIFFVFFLYDVKKEEVRDVIEYLLITGACALFVRLDIVPSCLSEIARLLGVGRVDILVLRVAGCRQARSGQRVEKREARKTRRRVRRALFHVQTRRRPAMMHPIRIGHDTDHGGTATARAAAAI